MPDPEPISLPRRVLRAPLLHFLVLGALLLVLEAAFERPEPLRVGEAQVRMLAEDHGGRFGRPPSAEELTGAVADWVADELAVREARRLGLHRGDLVIHRRLLDKMNLLEGSGHDGSGLETADFEHARPGDAHSEDSATEPADHPSARLARAFELGLDRADPIVRRRLIQNLERRWQLEDGPLRAGPEELRSYLEAHAERYRLPPRVRVSHVFFAGTGGDAESRARALLDELRQGEVSPQEASASGDAFPLGFHWSARTESRLARELGPRAAAFAFEVPVGEWTGPAVSAWGHHLLFVHERLEARLPEVEQIRRQLLQAMATERAEHGLDEKRQALRAATRVVVEMPSTALTSPAAPAPGGSP